MSWYTAPSARKFADQFAPDWPRRGSKDGSVGDTAHGARVSDHNPDYKNGGVVRAVDVDIKGRDKAAMIAAAIRDPRTRYLISDGRIWQNPAVYPGRGGWHKYNGSDGHYGHVHLSIRHAKKYENDTSPWGQSSTPTPTPPKEEEFIMATKEELADVLFRTNFTKPDGGTTNFEQLIRWHDNGTEQLLAAIKAGVIAGIDGTLNARVKVVGTDRYTSLALMLANNDPHLDTTRALIKDTGREVASAVEAVGNRDAEAVAKQVTEQVVANVEDALKNVTLTPHAE